jgi:hypothetical protein
VIALVFILSFLGCEKSNPSGTNSFSLATIKHNYSTTQIASC